MRLYVCWGTFPVPVLVLDDGEVIAGSQTIVAWASINPAGGGDLPRSPYR